MTDLRRTPLFDLHLEEGGKMVDFAGWAMPVQYPSGIINEHHQCRQKAALFDVSHMGQVVLHGDGAAAAMEALCPQDFTHLKPGCARYGFLTNADGGVMDDLIVSNASDDHYGAHLFVVVNASMRDQDIAHIKAHLDRHAEGVSLHELSDRALIALQGPLAETVLAPFCSSATDLAFMETAVADIDGVPCRISRLGYTGEDGYEISIPADRACDITRLLLAHEDCAMAGLGARDSLRLEAGLCLYGHELDTAISPVEAGLVWAMQKRRREEGGFPGDARIMSELADGPARHLVGLKPEGRMPARQGCSIVSSDGNEIGVVTSGGFGPSVDGPVAMGYVTSGYEQPGQSVHLDIRGRTHPAIVTALPFVAQRYKRRPRP